MTPRERILTALQTQPTVSYKELCRRIDDREGRDAVADALRDLLEEGAIEIASERLVIARGGGAFGVRRRYRLPIGGRP